jgi:protein-S-isoprenylcysteine O-methyltransferase Ste14
MPNYPAKAAGAFTPLFVIFIGGLFAGWALNLFLPFSIWPGVWIRIAGAVPLVIGIWLFLWARQTFRHHVTPLMPWNPVSELVQDGPYRFTRNPIYLAFVLWLLGASFIFNSAYLLALFVLVLVLFDRTQIPREERYLQEKFGEKYTQYKSKVRRWI